MELYSRVTTMSDDSLSRSNSKASPDNAAQKSNSLPRRSSVRKVKFVKNGDRFFGGVAFTISPQRHKTLEVLLNELTDVISLPYGVRSILTPKGGSRIDSVDQLENGKTYVCSSKLSLKKIDYSNVKSPTWSPGSKHVDSEKVPLPGVHSLLRRNTSDSTVSLPSGKSVVAGLPKGNPPKMITVIRNGPPPREKSKVLVNQRSAPSWEHLFQSISDLFQLKSHPVKRLFMMNGVEVQSISQLLQGGDYFIAVGSEPFDIDEFITGDTPKHHDSSRKVSNGLLLMSSSSSESDEKEKLESVPSRVIVQKRDMAKQPSHSKMIRSPLELSALNPHPLAIRNSIPHTNSNFIPHASDQQSSSGPQSDISSSNTSQIGGLWFRRPRGFSLDSEDLSKSTESDDDLIDRYGSINSRMRNFISTPVLKKSQFGYPIAIPDTPNSSNLSIGGPNMIEMSPRLPADYIKRERVTRTVGVQTFSVDQRLEDEVHSSHQTTDSDHFVTIPRSLENNYTRRGILGEGRFAVVWSASHRSTGKEYALKVINKAKVFGKDDVVNNELRIMRSVNHPNIVKLIEDFEDNEEIVLVMELLQGGDLFDAIIHCHHFTEATSKRITRDLGHALLYLHGKKIVHRDIKPENIFIAFNADGSHSLKLGDFGLATVVTEPLSLVCGTPCYNAPEVLLGTGYGIKVDIWASGVICYILLCGYPPFGSQKSSKSLIYQKVRKGEYSFFAPFWDTISAEAKDLISQLLQYSPNRRCSAEEMLRHPWLRDTSNMVDHFRGDGTDNLARQFHDHIHSRSKSKNTIVPILSSTALDKRPHQMHK